MNEDQVDSALRALERLPAGVWWSDVERRRAAEGGDVDLGPTGGGRRRLVAVVALAAAVTVVAGLVAFWPSPPSTTSVRTTPGPQQPSNTTTTTVSTTTSTTITADPLTARGGPVVAVTGDEYLVWGGETGVDSPRIDGFAVSLANGGVRPIPAAPIDASSGATGVWTGTELIVCCGSLAPGGGRAETGASAAWDPTTGEWRVLAPPPPSVAASFPASVWTGQLMVVIGAGGVGATYDPVADRWSELAIPALDRRPQVVWTGDEVVVWDLLYGTGVPDDAVNDRGWSWVPGDQAWAPLPDLPPGSRTRLASIAWTGREVVVWGESTSDYALGIGARWRPGDDSWRPTSPSPKGAIEGAGNGTHGSQAVVARADGHVVVSPLQTDLESTPLLLYDPTSDAWSQTDVVVMGYQPSMIVIGNGVYVPDPARPLVGRLP